MRLVTGLVILWVLLALGVEISGQYYRWGQAAHLFPMARRRAWLLWTQLAVVGVAIVTVLTWLLSPLIGDYVPLFVGSGSLLWLGILARVALVTHHRARDVAASLTE